MRVVQDQLGDDNIGAPGLRGQPVRTAPIEPGYSYHSESNMDLMQPAMSALAEAFEAIDLPLRSIENEWGPGQVECTFAAARRARSRRQHGAVPHRHQADRAAHGLLRDLHVPARPQEPLFERLASASVADRGEGAHHERGANLFMPARASECLSPLGLNYLGGLLKHAVPATVFTTPTVNGFRRFRANSLAPDRAGWGYDHRGAMLRVLGAPGDAASRIENRSGEPSANPYLFIASQIAAGLDGIDSKTDPGPRDDEPYAADRPLLPKSLPAALDALEKRAAVPQGVRRGVHRLLS